jgi:hypothetical protein
VVDAQLHVGVEPGSGLVARFGDALILIADRDGETEAAEALLQAVASAASAATPPGVRIATQLAGIVVGWQPYGGPGFGVVAPIDDGYVVLLHGPVTARIIGTNFERHLCGDEAVTWVDHKVAAGFDWLSLGGHDGPVCADPRSDLRAGAVPGNGFVLSLNPGGTRAYPPEPQAARPTGLAATSPTARDEPASAPATARVTEPGRHKLASPPADNTGSAVPTRRADDTADTSFEPAAPPRESIEVVPAGVGIPPGPGRATQIASTPLGLLVADDGMRIPLDRSYVLGREPDNDPAVIAGTATPIRLHDEESLISRVHCYITVVADQVLIRDAGSANGTFVAAPGAETWTQLGPDAAVLPPTWSVRLGKQVLTFEMPAGAS